MTEALGFLSQDEARDLLDIPPTVTTTLVTDLGALSYAGNALKLLRVNATADGWEFVATSAFVASAAIDTDTSLAANSDTRIASQKATKAYVDSIVTGLFDLKSDTDCSANPNYPSALKGDAHAVSVAGKIGGASGLAVDIGDVYVAKADNAGGTQAAVGSSWFILEHNLAGALLAANNLSDLTSPSAARTNLGLVPGTDVFKQRTIAAGSAKIAVANGDGASASPTIDLGSVASTDLSDVAQGIFTPVINFGGAATGITYSQQQGKHQRVGEMVTIIIDITMTSKGSATGSCTITGLPYTSAATPRGNAAILHSNMASVAAPFGQVPAASTSINVFNCATGAAVALLTDANFTNTTKLQLTLTYPI